MTKSTWILVNLICLLGKREKHVNVHDRVPNQKNQAERCMF